METKCLLRASIIQFLERREEPPLLLDPEEDPFDEVELPEEDPFDEVELPEEEPPRGALLEPELPEWPRREEVLPSFELGREEPSSRGGRDTFSTSPDRRRDAPSSVFSRVRRTGSVLASGTRRVGSVLTLGVGAGFATAPPP